MTSMLTTGRLFILGFTLLYTLGAGTYFYIEGNHEFLWYILVMALIVGLVGATLKTTQFPNWVLWLLSIWGLLHMAGGGMRVGDGVLYGAVLLPLYDGGADFVLIKYDQLVHAFGFGAAAVAVMSLLTRSMTGVSRLWIAVTAALTSMGLSVVNEIVEFAALIVIADTGVGGFYNLELDLVFNTLGAVIGVLCYRLFRKV